MSGVGMMEWWQMALLFGISGMSTLVFIYGIKTFRKSLKELDRD